MAPEDRVAFLWQISICQIANATYCSRSSSSCSSTFHSYPPKPPPPATSHFYLQILKSLLLLLLTAFCILYIPIKCLHTMPEFQIRCRSEKVQNWLTDRQADILTDERMPFRMQKRIKCRADWYTLYIPDNLKVYVWQYQVRKITKGSLWNFNLALFYF